MTIRIVRLGSDRFPGEGLRIGTVRRPPRGVPKKDYSVRNFYDVWLPTLAPSAATVKFAQQVQTARDWAQFRKRYRAEMAKPATAPLIPPLSVPVAPSWKQEQTRTAEPGGEEKKETGE